MEKDKEEKLRDKLKMFTEFYVLDMVKDQYAFVENIEITNFTKNKHTNKYYPEFVVRVSDDMNYSVLLLTNVKQTIRESIEKFFSDSFTILNANINFIKK